MKWVARKSRTKSNISMPIITTFSRTSGMVHFFTTVSCLFILLHTSPQNVSYDSAVILRRVEYNFSSKRHASVTCVQSVCQFVCCQVRSATLGEMAKFRLHDLPVANKVSCEYDLGRLLKINS